MKQAFALVLLLAASPPIGETKDWPQLLGPQRNGVYTGPPLATDWGEAGPKRSWQMSVGAGFAGPVVAGDRLILFHRVEGSELVDALDPEDGALVWRYEYETTYRDDFGFDEGPRAAPVIENDTVFTFGALGVLSAVALETGTLRWAVDTLGRYRASKGWFGVACSPLVDDGRVFVNVGGPKAGIVAFDAASGKELWISTEDEASYSSPVVADFGDDRLIVFFTRSGLVLLDPATGTLRHRLDWRPRSRASVQAAVPLIIGDKIFISASYGTGATALRVGPDGLRELWATDDALSNHYATSVHRNGILYGFHGRQEYSPSFRAIELETGKVRWSEDRFGAGTVTLAGDRLFIVRESGELLVAKASPESLQIEAQAQLLPGVIRAYPAFADGFVYVRSEETLTRFDLNPR